jgi:hypothetical protein
LISTKHCTLLERDDRSGIVKKVTDQNCKGCYV